MHYPIEELVLKIGRANVPTNQTVPTNRTSESPKCWIVFSHFAIRALIGCVCAFSPTSALATAPDPDVQLLLPAGLAESQLLHVNNAGDAVGFCELYDAQGRSIVDFACILTKQKVTPIPKLQHFRKMECVAISDSGLIVGHAYAPEQADGPPLQAIVFDSVNCNLDSLPSLQASKATLATSISSDGKTIAGVCGGQACIWNRQQESWTVAPLSKEWQGFLTQKVCLSDNGKLAVACERRNQIVQLSQWTFDEQADWLHAVRLEGIFHRTM